MEEQNEKEQEKQEKYKVYLEERKSLIEAERIGYQQFDKAILTLAAGALGLSLTFVKQIAPVPAPNTSVLVIMSWLFFSLSILSTLISFITSQKAFRRQMEILEDKWFSDNSAKEGENCFDKATDVLNIASLVLFIIGIVFLTIFASINLPS